MDTNQRFFNTYVEVQSNELNEFMKKYIMEKTHAEVNKAINLDLVAKVEELEKKIRDLEVINKKK